MKIIFVKTVTNINTNNVLIYFLGIFYWTLTKDVKISLYLLKEKLVWFILYLIILFYQGFYTMNINENMFSLS